MKIGIDIDGVLTDIYRFEIDYGSKYAYDKGILDSIDTSKYYSDDCFSWKEENEQEFWGEGVFWYAKNYPARDFASDVITKLKNDGHEIYIITAREYTTEGTSKGERMRNTVSTWLSKNNIYYDDIFYTESDKSKCLIDNNIDIMIEDSPYNIASLSRYVNKIICFDCMYNKECIGENIIRCYSWYDIYNKIKNMNV